MLNVIKRDGSLVPFELSKIKSALERAFIAEHIDVSTDVVELLSLRVTADFNKKIKDGMIVSIYLMWYGIVRFFIESMRTDALMLGTLKMAQLISITLFIIGLVLFIFSIK